MHGGLIPAPLQQIGCLLHPVQLLLQVVPLHTLHLQLLPAAGGEVQGSLAGQTSHSFKQLVVQQQQLT